MAWRDCHTLGCPFTRLRATQVPHCPSQVFTAQQRDVTDKEFLKIGRMFIANTTATVALICRRSLLPPRGLAISSGHTFRQWCLPAALLLCDKAREGGGARAWVPVLQSHLETGGGALRSPADSSSVAPTVGVDARLLCDDAWS